MTGYLLTGPANCANLGYTRKQVQCVLHLTGNRIVDHPTFSTICLTSDPLFNGERAATGKFRRAQGMGLEIMRYKDGLDRAWADDERTMRRHISQAAEACNARDDTYASNRLYQRMTGDAPGWDFLLPHQIIESDTYRRVRSGMNRAFGRLRRANCLPVLAIPRSISNRWRPTSDSVGYWILCYMHGNDLVITFDVQPIASMDRADMAELVDSYMRQLDGMVATNLPVNISSGLGERAPDFNSAPATPPMPTIPREPEVQGPPEGITFEKGPTGRIKMVINTGQLSAANCTIEVRTDTGFNSDEVLTMNLINVAGREREYQRRQNYKPKSGRKRARKIDL